MMYIEPKEVKVKCISCLMDCNWPQRKGWF